MKQTTVFIGDEDNPVEVEKYQADSVQVYADTPELLDEEFKRLSGDMAYWGERYTQSLRAHLEAKKEHKRVRARVELEVRETLKAQKAREAAAEPPKEPEPAPGKGRAPGRARAAAKPERVMEAEIDANVTTHPEVTRTEDIELAAEVEKERLKHVLDCLKAKRDMVIQLGAQYRAELERDPSLRERKRDFYGR